MPETVDQQDTRLFTWKKHHLDTRGDGFGGKRSSCGQCGQQFRSQPSAATCPGVQVYSPYAHAGHSYARPANLATVEELTRENLRPTDYAKIVACLHASNSHYFVALYKRDAVVAREPGDAPPPAEAISASCVPAKPPQERKPRAPRHRTAPDPLWGEQLVEAQKRRLARGVELPTHFEVDEKEYALHLALWREENFGSREGWSAYGNYWSPEALLEWVSKSAPGVKVDGDRRFRVTAGWRGEAIGEGAYRIRERFDLSTVETEEASGALVDVIEAAVARILAEERMEAERQAEALRTVPCVTCDTPVLASAGPARQMSIVIDGGEHTTFEWYGCERLAFFVLDLAFQK